MNPVTEQDEESGALQRLIPVFVLLGVAGATTVDLILDAPERWLSFHAIYELLVAVGGTVTALALWLAWRRAEQSLARIGRSLAERSAERDAWRTSARQALEGLGRAIDRQLQAWKLTPTEREIALELLKGRSHKVIAGDSGRSERTVRQHAVTIYQKAGVGSRAELGAFFLEGLFLPGTSPSREGL